MKRLFTIILSLCVLVAPAYAEENIMIDQDTIQVLDEQDFEDIAIMSKLEETVPVAEENCIRFRKNKEACLCENMHLYEEHNRSYKALQERHPEWAGKTLIYDFYQDGVTYSDKRRFGDFEMFTNKMNYIDCDQVEY